MIEAERLHARDAVNEDRRRARQREIDRWDAYALAVISSTLRANPNFHLHDLCKNAVTVADKMLELSDQIGERVMREELKNESAVKHTFT